ncbi:signal peptidase I [Patescibacteria group bacterium]|nr:signal peptidase I [Patescibacteria group bacterium]MCL5092025.1 signal peptidase I [Patescibacteria group bacterium]
MQTRPAALRRFDRLTHARIYYTLVVVYVLATLTIGLLSSEKLLWPFRFFTIRSNSMNPVLNTGSLIMVKNQPFYQANDIISYYAKVNGRETIITHRIWRIGGNVYITKGDANQAIDREIVVPRLVIGKVILIIPIIGYLAAFIKSAPGSFIFITLPAAVFVTIELIKIVWLYR